MMHHEVLEQERPQKSSLPLPIVSDPISIVVGMEQVKVICPRLHNLKGGRQRLNSGFWAQSPKLFPRAAWK